MVLSWVALTEKKQQQKNNNKQTLYLKFRSLWWSWIRDQLSQKVIWLNPKHPKGHLGYHTTFLHHLSTGQRVFISKLKAIETAISFGT